MYSEAVRGFSRWIVRPQLCSARSKYSFRLHLIPNFCGKYLIDHAQQRLCLEVCAQARRWASGSAVNDQSRVWTQKAARSREAKTSLGRVAVAAGLSRGRKSSAGSEQYLVTKSVTAFCSAERYDISNVARALHGAGFVLDPTSTGLYPQVVHVNFPGAPPPAGNLEHRGPSTGDVFIFPSGTVVAWDVEKAAIIKLIETILSPAAFNAHVGELEIEDLDYFEDSLSDTSVVHGDTIRLGTKRSLPHDADSIASLASALSAPDFKATNSHNQLPAGNPNHETTTALGKIAFSSGLARSVKLAVLERALDDYFESTQNIPTLLSRGSKLPFSRSFILRKTGELLSIRARLNFVSELTDSIPDLFWDSRSELGLETYFDQVSRALDVRIRIKVLNEKMDYASEVAAILRERLSERHGFALEWLIIFLISIEVCFATIDIWNKRHGMPDALTTEALLRDYLQKELEKRSERN